MYITNAAVIVLVLYLVEGEGAGQSTHLEGTSEIKQSVTGLCRIVATRNINLYINLFVYSLFDSDIEFGRNIIRG